jgi:hypothetical protein
MDEIERKYDVVMNCESPNTRGWCEAAVVSGCVSDWPIGCVCGWEEISGLKRVSGGMV